MNRRPADAVPTLGAVCNTGARRARGRAPRPPRFHWTSRNGSVGALGRSQVCTAARYDIRRGSWVVPARLPPRAVLRYGGRRGARGRRRRRSEAARADESARAKGDGPWWARAPRRGDGPRRRARRRRRRAARGTPSSMTKPSGSTALSAAGQQRREPRERGGDAGDEGHGVRRQCPSPRWSRASRAGASRFAGRREREAECRCERHDQHASAAQPHQHEPARPSASNRAPHRALPGESKRRARADDARTEATRVSFSLCGRDDDAPMLAASRTFAPRSRAATPRRGARPSKRPARRGSRLTDRRAPACSARRHRASHRALVDAQITAGRDDRGHARTSWASHRRARRRRRARGRSLETRPAHATRSAAATTRTPCERVGDGLLHHREGRRRARD